MKLFKYIEDNKDKKIDIYFDMDGVFAEYDVGNFDYNTIRPIKSVIGIMKKLMDDGINVKVLSICRIDKIVQEKYDWIDKNANFLKREDLFFLSKENIEIESNELKSNFLKENINNDHVNILIDDDSLIIKKVTKENKDDKVFHVSSLME